MDPSRSSELRKLPQVDRLASALDEQIPAPLRVRAARMAIGAASDAILGGGAAPEFDQLVEQARTLSRTSTRKGLTPIVNATGVILHTNLGRAPLGLSALMEIESSTHGYVNLEYDLETKRRGSRYHHATHLLQSLTGAEAALVVNNNAAALLMAMTLFRGEEVIVSRGELVEIGGEFRIPEIINESGASMREVGTTNRTHLKDYERAIASSTGAILKVHPSNYRVVGFTKNVEPGEVARLAHKNELAFINDLGSGLLRNKIGGVTPRWLADEPTVEDALGVGADLVTFSGDKLLGGPQAGLILGRQALIDRLTTSPLLRTFRVDKMTIAALTATLTHYANGTETELPIWQMALLDPATIESRSLSVIEQAGGAQGKIQLSDGSSTLGGGSAPGSEIPTVLIEILPRGSSVNAIHSALIDSDPPILSRIEGDRILLDLRTVHPEQDRQVAQAIASCLE